MSLVGYVTGVSQTEQWQGSNKRWFQFSLQTESNSQRVVSYSPGKWNILLELEDSDEAGCELHQIKTGKIDYIMEANTTIKKKKLSFPKQEISMSLHTLNKIIHECQLYQRIAKEGVIYQISSEQSDVKGQKFFQYKKAMLKDSNDTIETEIVGKNYLAY